MDPVTGRSDWSFVRVNGRIVGVHSSSGGRPLKQAGFDGEEVAFAGKARYSDWVFIHAAAAAASAPSDPGRPTAGPGVKP